MFKKFVRLIWTIIDLVPRGWNKVIVSPMKKTMLHECGKQVYIGRGSVFTWNHVSVGDYVSFNTNALLICTRARINIGDHVMFGPNVTMITGGHRMDIVGRYMNTITNDEKLPENDQDIILEGDN